MHERCQGAYGVVAMITGHGLVGFRDPNGIRPLIYGSRVTEQGEMEYIIASESVAITALGFKIERDIEPGEAIFINANGELFSKQCAANPNTAHVFLNTFILLVLMRLLTESRFIKRV